MKIERIKYTKQFSFMDVNEWIGVDGQLEKGETVMAAIVQAKGEVEKAHREANPELYKPIAKKIDVKKETQADIENAKLFEATKKKIIAAKTKEAAGEILLSSQFKFNPELNKIMMMKPSKNKGVKLP